MAWNRIRTIDWKSYFLISSTSPLTALLALSVRNGQRLLCVFKQWKRGFESYLFLLLRS